MVAKVKLGLLLFFASLYSSLVSGSEGKFVNLNLSLCYMVMTRKVLVHVAAAFSLRKMLALPKPPVCSANIAA